MAGSEAASAKHERPRNVDIVSVEILGRPVEFSVVHSFHFLIDNKLAEVSGAHAFFLEGVLPAGTKNDERFGALATSYRRLAELATAPNNPLPMVSIDVDITLNDLMKTGVEFGIKNVGAGAGGAWLLSRSFINARNQLTRRAFLQAAVGAVLVFEPLLTWFSTVADYRPGSTSGNIARSLSALQDKSPLDPKLDMGLRNRIFALKSLIAARFLVEGIDGDSVWKPSPVGKALRIPIIVGAAHTDMARHLRRDPDELLTEILEICQTYSLSGEFLTSVVTIPIGKYDTKRGGWDTIALAYDKR